MSVTSRLKAIQIIGQRKVFYQRIPDSSKTKETVDIDTLVTSKNDDRKIMQIIRITSRPPLKIRKWNQLSQSREPLTKVIPTEKTQADYISTMSQEFKRGSKGMTRHPAYPILQFIQQFHIATRSTNSDTTTIFHAQS